MLYLVLTRKTCSESAVVRPRIIFINNGESVGAIRERNIKKCETPV